MLMILVMFGLALAGMAQESVPEEIEEVNVIPAQFTGVKYVENSSVAENEVNLLSEYLTRNIIYPSEAKKCNMQGVEIATFTVDEKGNVGNIEIVNSVCPEIDEEFIRVLKTTSGKWKPALKNETNDICYKEVSVAFSLMQANESTEEYFMEKATNNFTRGSEKLFIDHKIKKAEKCFNRGLTYMPYDGSLLYLRGLCRYERGNIEGAKKDWERYTDITGDTVAPEELVLDKKEFKGVEAFANLYNN